MEVSLGQGRPPDMPRLDPWYVTGLVDGEGCFSVSFNCRSSLSTGIEVRPSFSLSQKVSSLAVLKALRRFFGCGGIRYSRRDNTYKYEVRSVADLVRKVIPHFRKYPLRTAKREDFEKFAHICRSVYAQQHRDPACLREIIDVAYAMNQAGKRRYTKEDLLRVLGKVNG